MIASVMKIPAEVVRDEPQRLAAGIGGPGAGQGVADQVADRGAADGVVLCAVTALEQQRHRRVPYSFVVVIGGHQRHGAVLAADAGDDLAEHVGQFRADDQEPLGVGLGRGDLRQRDQLAGGGQLVLDEAVVGQLGEFLDPDPGVAENLHCSPGPECLVLFQGEVAILAAAGVLCPDPAR
jgi:hypothetical protein